jgi:hypothetical protein
MPGPKAFVYGRLFHNPDVARLTYEERWLWIYFLAHADHDGRGRAEPEFLKAEAFGYDPRVGVTKIREYLKHLSHTVGLLIYGGTSDSDAEGDCISDASTRPIFEGGVRHAYFQVTTWHKWQVIDRAYYRPSEYPAPPGELYSDPWYPSPITKTDESQSNGGDKSLPSFPSLSSPKETFPKETAPPWEADPRKRDPA